MKRTNHTKAAMAASKKVNKNKDPDHWQLLFDYYLEKYTRLTISRRKSGSLKIALLKDRATL